MTKKLIAKAYIEAAEECILKGKKDGFSKFIDRLMENNLGYGICTFISEEYNFYCYHKKYIRKYYRTFNYNGHVPFVNFWGIYPKATKTKEKAIQALQYRINILKTWI